MPKENGIGLARSLASMEQPPLIIFVTAYNAHAVEAFEVHALDYLLKPFNASRFAQALEHADEILTQRRGYGKALQTYVDAEDRAKQDPANYIQNVVVRSVGEMECVRIDQINWLASASNYVELHLENRVVLHRITLSKLEQMLDPKEFQRIHRTTIVRKNQLQQISVVGDGVYQLKLFCGATVPVSEKYIDEVRAAFEA
jgi:two-component system LytT family response regulator